MDKTTTTTKLKSLCDDKQNVGFVDYDQTPMTQIPTTVDSTVYQDDDNKADLASFLARPVDVYDTSCPVGVVTEDIGINIWELWANNTYVKSKLNNFYLFRGDLMIKVVINGTPFHFGRWMVSYEPLATYSDLGTYPGDGTVTSNSFLRNIMACSQRPRIFLNPTDSQGGCLCVPFFWPKNFIKVNKNQDWIDLGKLSLYQIAPLQAVNNSTKPVHITVFCWVENAELKVPTVSLAAAEGCYMSKCKNKMTLPRAEADEMKPKKKKKRVKKKPLPQTDEYDEQAENGGVISRPAAAVAKAAGALSAIPYIQPYAIATSVAATAIGKIASLFGYSRPNVISPPSFMRREPYGTLAYTSSSDAVIKLTLDPKQQLTVDPRTVGLDVGDEMTLKYLTSKEGFATYFDWIQADVAGTNKFFCNVNPCVLRKVFSPGVNSSEVQMTPLGYFSTPFRFWSGTIIYRFEVIASQYHKGRLKIAWDPYSRANAQTVDNLNISYIKILDLAETRNVEIAISWGVDKPYLLTDPNGNATIFYTDPNDAATADVPDSNFSNGVFNVQVLNPLVSPQPTGDSSIRVNVYVRGGADFELYEPDHTVFNDLSVYDAAEADVMIKDAAYQEVTEPKKLDLITEESDVGDKKALVFFGDPVTSFRSLLKRYNFHGTIFALTSNSNSSDVDLIRYTAPNFPAYYGYDLAGLYHSPTGSPVNPFNMTLLNYVTPAFAGRRGGVRFKYGIGAQPTTGAKYLIARAHNTCKIGIKSAFNNAGLANNANPPQSVNFIPNEVDGAHAIIMRENPLLNVEMPFYSPFRFRCARNANVYTGIAGDFTQDNNNHNIIMTVVDNNNSASRTCAFALDRWVAAGDDYSLFFFVNAPLLYRYNTRLPGSILPQYTNINTPDD